MTNTSNTFENTNISRDSVFDRVSRDNVFGLIKSKFIRPEGIEAHLKKLLHYPEEGHIGSRCYDTSLEELYVKLVKRHPEITQNFEEKIFPSVSFQEFLKEIIDNEESVSGMPKETVTLAIKVFTVLANVQRTFYYEHERKYLEEEKQDIWKGVSKTYAYFQYSNEEPEEQLDYDMSEEAKEAVYIGVSPLSMVLWASLSVYQRWTRDELTDEQFECLKKIANEGLSSKECEVLSKYLKHFYNGIAENEMIGQERKRLLYDLFKNKLDKDFFHKHPYLGKICGHALVERRAFGHPLYDFLFTHYVRDIAIDEVTLTSSTLLEKVEKLVSLINCEALRADASLAFMKAYETEINHLILFYYSKIINLIKLKMSKADKPMELIENKKLEIITVKIKDQKRIKILLELTSREIEDIRKAKMILVKGYVSIWELGQDRIEEIINAKINELITLAKLEAPKAEQSINWLKDVASRTKKAITNDMSNLLKKLESELSEGTDETDDLMETIHYGMLKTKEILEEATSGFGGFQDVLKVESQRIRAFRQEISSLIYMLDMHYGKCEVNEVNYRLKAQETYHRELDRAKTKCHFSKNIKKANEKFEQAIKETISEETL